MKKHTKALICSTLCIILITLSTPQNINASSIQYKSVGLPTMMITERSLIPAAVQVGSVAKTYTVTFDAKEGTVTASNKTVSFGSTYGVLPTATREQYEFKGWYTFASGGNKITENSTVNETISHTLYARWIGKENVITLSANGGILTEKTITVRYGNRYQLPTPTKKDYTFVGWYSAINGEDKITSNSIYDATSKKILYAHWIEKILKITFIAYNGDDAYYKEVTCGKIYSELPKPKRKGETFGGWYTWADYSNSDAKPITEKSIVTESAKLKLFARWYNAK